MERTLVIVKPDGLMRRLVGEVISRLERKGLKIVGLKLARVSEAEARQLYKVHEGKPFYEGLVKYITSEPVVLLVAEGSYAVQAVRNTIGDTFGYKAQPGTIRGEFALGKGQNIVHAADSLENAQREISIFFKESELIEYQMDDDEWIQEQQQ